MKGDNPAADGIPVEVKLCNYGDYEVKKAVNKTPRLSETNIEYCLVPENFMKDLVGKESPNIYTILQATGAVKIFVPKRDDTPKNFLTTGHIALGIVGSIDAIKKAKIFIEFQIDHFQEMHRLRLKKLTTINNINEYGKNVDSKTMQASPKMVSHTSLSTYNIQKPDVNQLLLRNDCNDETVVVRRANETKLDVSMKSNKDSSYKIINKSKKSHHESKKISGMPEISYSFSQEQPKEFDFPTSPNFDCVEKWTCKNVDLTTLNIDNTFSKELFRTQRISSETPSVPKEIHGLQNIQEFRRRRENVHLEAKSSTPEFFDGIKNLEEKCENQAKSVDLKKQICKSIYYNQRADHPHAAVDLKLKPSTILKNTSYEIPKKHSIAVGVSDDIHLETRLVARQMQQDTQTNLDTRTVATKSYSAEPIVELQSVSAEISISEGNDRIGMSSPKCTVIENKASVSSEIGFSVMAPKNQDANIRDFPRAAANQNKHPADLIASKRKNRNLNIYLRMENVPRALDFAYDSGDIGVGNQGSTIPFIDDKRNSTVQQRKASKLEDLLKRIGYEGPLLVNKKLEAALTEGLTNFDFNRLIIYLTEELHSVKEMNEHITLMTNSVNWDIFSAELGQFIREIRCPYKYLVAYEIEDRLRTSQQRRLLIKFLASEVICNRLISNVDQMQELVNNMNRNQLIFNGATIMDLLDLPVLPTDATIQALERDINRYSNPKPSTV